MRQGTRLIAGVLAAVAAGGVLVAVGVALLLGNIVHLRSTAKATLRTGNYLEATINLEELVLDAETGLRGYVITGRSLFLQPERTAAAQLPGAAAALKRAAAADQGAFSTQAASVVGSADSYMSTYVPRIIGEVTAGSLQRALEEAGEALSFGRKAGGLDDPRRLRAEANDDVIHLEGEGRHWREIHVGHVQPDTVRVVVYDTAGTTEVPAPLLGPKFCGPSAKLTKSKCVRAYLSPASSFH